MSIEVVCKCSSYDRFYISVKDNWIEQLCVNLQQTPAILYNVTVSSALPVQESKKNSYLDTTLIHTHEKKGGRKTFFFYFP